MDFRLKVFLTVAQRASFTKAAQELFISQPAVTKHIKELEEEYKIKFFDRTGNKVVLTTAGLVLESQAKKLFAIYRTIDFELSALVGEQRGTLRLGASTTISQYVIPPVLAKFHQSSKEVKVIVSNDNTEQIEKALVAREIDLGVVEGQSKSKAIQYIPFLQDELVLVCSTATAVPSQEIIMDQLVQLPFVTREIGSGTLEVIQYALKKVSINLSQLQIEMQLGSTESIKSYLMNSNCFAFLSIHAIKKELKNNELTIVKIKNLTINRSFFIISLQGQIDPLSTSFLRIMQDHYNLDL
jgi:DNA-binding transcriptional LysR family regulator